MYSSVDTSTYVRILIKKASQSPCTPQEKPHLKEFVALGEM